VTALTALAVAIVCWAAGASGGWLLQRRPVGTVLGAGGAISGAVAAGIAGARALTALTPQSWHAPWSVPAGALAVRLDPLAAVFLIPLAAVGGLCAVYGVAYLRRHAHGRPIGGSLATYNILLLSMALVVTANDVVLLLVAWELMTLSSWALVVSDHEVPAVRAAGLQYLVAGHLATAALLLLGLFLGTGSGTFEIAALSTPATVPSGLLFGLAVIGFGTKAGIVPMHVWLPDAHPAAPSHVSALMSAIMITMGFYGLARFVPLFGPPALWWGYVLIALGVVGAAGGVAFAIAQRDVKRVLAYSTVENAGLVTLAVGLGLLATAQGEPVLAGLAWTGALLHLWNHALAKALLFLGFGAVAQGAKSRSLDALGGFLRGWPLVGGTLLIGAAAIASLPGLNVFTSEWLLLRGALLGAVATRGGGSAGVAFLGSVLAIALTGGLAVACFTRLVGVALSGSARTAEAEAAPRPGWAMVLPLVFFAAACITMAVIPSAAAGVLGAAVNVIAPGADAQAAHAVLRPLAVVAPLLAAAMALLVALRRGLGGRAAPRESVTWGCAYAAPSVAMQYTSSSFAEPLTRLLQPLLHTEVQRLAEPGQASLWPRVARWASRTADRALVGLYLPLFAAVARGGQRLRAYHQARVTWSLLYIGATVLAVLGLLFLPGVRR
jgi:formate hydrogenlyase subunit 3/multisubunit Na+/H+ antiporter MnhD subunit